MVCGYRRDRDDDGRPRGDDGRPRGVVRRRSARALPCPSSQPDEPASVQPEIGWQCDGSERGGGGARTLFELFHLRLGLAGQGTSASLGFVQNGLQAPLLFGHGSRARSSTSTFLSRCSLFNNASIRVTLTSSRYRHV